jgi:hypothetical protein
MYTRVPENRKSLTIIELVTADKTAISSVVIIPGWKIMQSWFSRHQTSYKLITLSPSGYTNEGITIE